ncbi:MAG TPA: SPOR domain-containing protein [Burkholderiaceae bacterium]|nr:SPOR domain-containing protein [Burkholderiaceae bacterium]
MFNYKSKQAGGTFLGLILGLVIGLGIAVVVAVMIMKTPIPFTNKQARPERPADAAGGQIADPNQAMYGKRDAARNGAPDVAAPAPVPPNTAQAPDSRAPIVDNSILDKPKKPDDAKADSGQWIYYLQAGAFRSQADADSTRAKLALLGFEAQVTERESDQGTLYRVRLGPFTQLETVNRMRSKLSDNGVDAAVVRTAK